MLASIDLARAVCELGRPAESLEILEESEQHPAPPDIEHRRQEGNDRVLSRSHDWGGSSRQNRWPERPCATPSGTQFLGYHAEALLVLAEVLQRDGRPAEAAGPLEEAVALYERKGNVVSAARRRPCSLS